MNRMIKLFQQKSNKAFDDYLLAKRKSLSLAAEHVAATVGSDPPWPNIQDLTCAVLKAESDIWARAAELLRKEELNK
jgi:hypothetical protein